MNRLAAVGLIVTETIGGGGGGGPPPPPPPPPPPQDSNEIVGRSSRVNRILALLFSDFRASPPISNPITETDRATEDMLREEPGAIAFGPSVVTVRVTLLLPAPALMGEGGLKTQVGPATTTGVTEQV